MISPTESKISTKSSTLDSDSEDDSPRTPPLKGILKKTCVRTVGSSSGSDVALHEEGAELSESDSASKKSLETWHVLYPLVWSVVALATSMIVLALLAQY